MVNGSSFKRIMLIVLALIAGGIVFFAVLPSLLLPLGLNLLPTPPAPKNTYGEFPFHLVYEVDGKQHIINDTFICSYAGRGMDTGNGKYIKWEARFAHNTQVTRYYNGNESYQYGIVLFSGFVRGQGGISIYYDIGNPQYYLGYRDNSGQKPGHVYFSGPSARRIIGEDELWEKYKIKIVIQELSRPMIGNNLKR